MRAISFTLIFLAVVVACNASIFSGKNVSPGNNPPVEKYHTNTDTLTDFGETLGIHIVPGVIVGVLAFICSSIWCRAFFCCCCSKKHKTRGRRGSMEEEEIAQARRIVVPAISWTLRITIGILFLATSALIIVGFVASGEYHNNLLSSTETVITTVDGFNASFFNVVDTLENLQGVSLNVTDDVESFNQSISKLTDRAHQLHDGVEHIDGTRVKITMGMYVVILLPLLIGLVGAIIAKGRLTFVMSALLPILLLSIFIVNVDACYVFDNELTGNTNANTSAAFNSYFNCSDNNAQPLLTELGWAYSDTQYEIDHTTNATYKAELQNQLVLINNATATVQQWNGCNQITNMLSNVYSELCGSAVQASMFMWQSQIGVAILLTLLFVVGIVAEKKVGKKHKHDYNSLASLINE